VKALTHRSINTAIKREQQPFSQPNQKYSKTLAILSSSDRTLLAISSHQAIAHSKATSPTKQRLADLLLNPAHVCTFALFLTASLTKKTIYS